MDFDGCDRMGIDGVDECRAGKNDAKIHGGEIVGERPNDATH